jgi:hypothetical protein
VSAGPQTLKLGLLEESFLAEASGPLRRRTARSCALPKTTQVAVQNSDFSERFPRKFSIQ